MKQAPDLPNSVFTGETTIQETESDSAKAKKGASALEDTLLKLSFAEEKFVGFTFGVFNRADRRKTQHGTATT